MATVAIVNDQDVVTAEIFIAAPPARVFEAITDPAQMSRWWGQNNMYRIKQTEADLRVGGKWSSVGEAADGTAFRIDGEYLEFDPPRLLVQTWLASWTGPIRTVVRWELEPQSIHGLIRADLSAPEPALWSRSGTKASPPVPRPQPQPATPKAGSAFWDGSLAIWKKAKPSTRARNPASLQ